MGFIDTLASQFLNKATLVYKEPIAEQAFHLRIESASLKKASYVPGYFLRIFCGMGKDVGMKEKIRSYSVWHFDPLAGSIDLAVCTHSNGPGTAWAKECSVGDTVYFGWHKGKFILDETGDFYVMIGDSSALAHLYEIRRHLPANRVVHGLFYAEHAADLFADLDGSRPFDFYTLPINPAEELIARLPDQLAQLPGRGIVYIGGDSRVCVHLHQHFRHQLGWDVKQIRTKPFWNPEKRGLE